MLSDLPEDIKSITSAFALHEAFPSIGELVSTSLAKGFSGVDGGEPGLVAIWVSIEASDGVSRDGGGTRRRTFSGLNGIKPTPAKALLIF